MGSDYCQMPPNSVMASPGECFRPSVMAKSYEQSSGQSKDDISRKDLDEAR